MTGAEMIRFRGESNGMHQVEQSSNCTGVCTEDPSGGADTYVSRTYTECEPGLFFQTCTGSASYVSCLKVHYPTTVCTGSYGITCYLCSTGNSGTTCAGHTLCP